MTVTEEIRLDRAGLKTILIRTAVGIAASEAFVLGTLYVMDVNSFGYGAFFSFVCPATLAPYFTWKDLNRMRLLERYRGELELTNRRLEVALSDVRVLRGLLPICASCKKVRNDEGAWDQIETYIAHHTDAQFTHAICPECTVRLYGEELPEMAAETGMPN
ncbi:MAG TPA: hypothetical protein VJ961_06750 [Mariprofundaceae bacterium]|nr:hypothetical protein [Mariprofundaceae bacterium]